MLEHGFTPFPEIGTMDDVLTLEQRPVMYRDLVKATIARVALIHGLPAKVVAGRCRTPHVAKARMHVYCVLHEAGLSYSDIGRFMKRDRTAVAHGVARYRKLHGGDYDTPYGVAAE